MKIGIDAKWYFDGPVSAKVLLQNVLDNLIDQKKSDEVILFVKKSDFMRARNHFPDDITIVPIKKFLNNALTNIFIFPFYIFFLKLDVLLCQYYSPLFFKSKTAVYIYDLLWTDYPQYFSLKERFYFDLAIPGLRKAKAVITISQSEYERIEKNISNRKGKLFQFHLGADHFSAVNDVPYQSCFFEPLEKFILCVGRLNDRKNIKVVVDALRMINEEVHLVVVGAKSHQYTSLDSHISDYKLERRIRFLGHISDKELSYLYSKAYVFCFPSFCEGFGLPPLEAMKLGCPVIASNATSMPEICGEAALYFDPNDYRGLADIINEISNENRCELIKKGYDRVEKFNWSKTSKKLLSVLRTEFENK